MSQEVVTVSTRMNNCPFCGAKRVKNYNANARLLITLNGELWISERILRRSNRECPGHALSFRADGTYSYKGKTLYIFRSYENGVVLYANTTGKDDVSHFQPLLGKAMKKKEVLANAKEVEAD